ncbi:hypothetical protein [Photobacterium minamisatsumaniensis]|uniref:hypothetical protein n=1 Tax=Photobacterium minamisatsumaniensis TaxID=2910233 RepID=UPI003D141370
MKLLWILIFTFLPFYSQIISAKIPGPPPISGIKSLKITNTHDGKFYANGKMQTAVYVQYDLANGYEVEDIKLKRLYYRDDLEDYGWSSSQELNEYKKQITDRKYNNQDYNISNNTEVFYISAELGSEYDLDICVELTAKKSSTKSIKSTCDNETVNAYVALSAIPPFKYLPSDFELVRGSRFEPWEKDQKHYMRVDSLVLANKNLEPIKKIQNIDSIIDSMALDFSTDKAFMYQQKIEVDGLHVSSTHNFIVDRHKLNNVFSISANTMELVSATVHYPMVANPIVDVVTYQRYENTLLVNDLFCKATKKIYDSWLEESIWVNDCQTIERAKSKKGWERFESYIINDSIKDDIKERRLTLIDEYGTEHQVSLLFDDGDTKLHIYE